MDSVPEFFNEHDTNCFHYCSPRKHASLAVISKCIMEKPDPPSTRLISIGNFVNEQKESRSAVDGVTCYVSGCFSNSI